MSPSILGKFTLKWIRLLDWPSLNEFPNLVCNPVTPASMIDCKDRWHMFPNVSLAALTIDTFSYQSPKFGKLTGLARILFPFLLILQPFTKTDKLLFFSFPSFLAFWLLSFHFCTFLFTVWHIWRHTFP